MWTLLFVFLLLSTLTLESKGSEHFPQVYENLQENQQQNIRVVRDPYSEPKLLQTHQAPIFTYRTAIQQDQRQVRYAQQQKVDHENLLKYNNVKIHSNISSEANVKLKNIANKIALLSKKPNSIQTKIKINRNDQNNQLIYVQPSEDKITALHALVGHHPQAQLEGFKKLIETPNYVLPPIQGKDFTPIEEHSFDIPNPQATASSEYLNLDANVKFQLDQALAQAQKEAMAQVEAQHEAIAKAQVQAQKHALAQLAFHNQPSALPLKSFYPSDYAQQDRKNVLDKINVSKTKSVRQGHGSPNGFQQIVLETQLENEKVFPTNKLVLSDKHQGHQYAARYAFGYKIRDVKMGNDFGHEEQRNGKEAKGQYHVLLPDGRMQKVEYYAGPTGYHAKVTYENVAHH